MFSISLIYFSSFRQLLFPVEKCHLNVCLNELKFCKVSPNSKSNSFWKFQLSIFTYKNFWNPTTEKCFTCKEQEEVMLTIRYRTFWFCQEKWKLRVSHLSIQKIPNNGVNSSLKKHSCFHAPVIWRDIDEKISIKEWNLKKKISWKHRCMKLRMYSSNRIDFDQLKWILIAVKIHIIIWSNIFWGSILICMHLYFDNSFIW